MSTVTEIGEAIRKLPPQEAWKLAADLREYLDSLWDKEFEEDVKTGSTLSEAMHRQPVFSALLKRMVAMGESSGNLDKALDNVSEYYSEVIPRRIKKIFSLLEPMLMVFLISLVGAVALAIYLPIISLMGAIR